VRIHAKKVRLLAKLSRAIEPMFVTMPAFGKNEILIDDAQGQFIRRRMFMNLTVNQLNDNELGQHTGGVVGGT
jgi:hypothetical protein